MGTRELLLPLYALGCLCAALFVLPPTHALGALLIGGVVAVLHIAR